MSKSATPCRDLQCKHGDCSLLRHIKQLETRIRDETQRVSKAESKMEDMKADFAHMEALHEKEKSELKGRIVSLKASVTEKSEALKAEKAAAAELKDNLRLVTFSKHHQAALAQQALLLINKVQLDKSDTLSDIIHDYANRLGADINLHALSSEKPASTVSRTTKRPRSEEPNDNSAGDLKQAARPRVPSHEKK